MIWLLLVVAAAFLLSSWIRERFTDPEFPVTRPMKNGAWLSKIDAQAPIGGNDDDYIAVLQAFYDQVYAPSTTRPRISDLEAFLKTPTANRPGMDINSLRKIISTSFRLEQEITTAAREERQIKFRPSEALQPKDAYSPTDFTRDEQVYVPADSREGELPEGVHKPTEQTEPTRPGYHDDKSTSWSDSAFYSVCEGEACTKHML
jgi:hypothetical protein